MAGPRRDTGPAISFCQPEEEMLILGDAVRDAVHAEDVECVNLALSGSNAIDARSADRREAQPALCPAHMPGHGPATSDEGIRRGALPV
jgi:hypothetical protein